MTAALDGRVAVITGAGRGIGRAHAHAFADAGAAVVVNDLGTTGDGKGRSEAPADTVVGEIFARGGQAVANVDDVADEEGSERCIAAALDTFGRLDILVNNAGILRDRMLVNMSLDEWDEVCRVHLRGMFAPTRAAVRHWRAMAKSGQPVDGRLINTTSSTGLFGNVGQANYAAAKAGVAAFTIVAAQELERYGVTVNAIYPTAASRLTNSLLADATTLPGSRDVPSNDELLPETVSPLLVWLASTEAGAVTGRVFGVRGNRVSLAEGWRETATVTRDGAATSGSMALAVHRLLA